MNEYSKPLKLISKGKPVTIKGYSGVCHGCNSPVHYLDEILMIVLYRDENIAHTFCLDNLECPFCNHKIGLMTIYLNMEVSKELAEVTHENR
jgi:hypothetical protein